MVDSRSSERIQAASTALEISAGLSRALGCYGPPA